MQLLAVDTSSMQQQQQVQKTASNNNDCASLGTCSTASLSDSSSSNNTPNNNNNTPNNNNNTPPTRRRRRNRNRRRKKTIPPPRHDTCRYLALDCEMVQVGNSSSAGDDTRSALARVTVVNWHGHVVLDEYVQTNEPVLDYRTAISGIEPHHLRQAVYTAAQVRTVLQELLGADDTILIGHALKNDLRALGLTHPWYRTRDTAKYEPFLRQTTTTTTSSSSSNSHHEQRQKLPRKLRDLAAEHLGRRIQVPGRPHCPVQDAVAALDLYKLVQVHWEQVMDYKRTKTAQIQQLAAQQEQEQQQEL